MSTSEFAKVIDSYDQLIGVIASIHQDQECGLLINGQHNSYELFLTRFVGAIGVCADFDGTLHPGNQWAAMRTLMTPERIEAEKVDLAAYLSRDDHDDLADTAFILRSIGRLQGAYRRDLLHLAEGLIPREGVEELLMSFDSRNVAIVSFGVQDLINFWVKRHLRREDWESAAVFALRLKWFEQGEGHWHGRVAGCDPATVVSNGNKGYVRDVFCATRKFVPWELLVLGDAPTDVLMMHPDNVGVLIVPKVDPDPGRMAYRMRGLEKLWPRVSAVFVTDQTGSLKPLARLRQR